MLIRQNVVRTALFHRPALAEHFKLKRLDAKSLYLAGLSNAIWHSETTSSNDCSLKISQTKKAWGFNSTPCNKMGIAFEFSLSFQLLAAFAQNSKDNFRCWFKN
jgi:hypothetical protein